MTAQAIFQRLIVLEVDPETAKQATTIIYAYCVRNEYHSASMMLVEDFAALYKLDASTAIEVLKSNLID